MDIKQKLTEAVFKSLELQESTSILWTVPKRNDQGDLSSNVAMLLAKELKMPPRKIAESIVDKVDWEELGIEKVEIAGPGFLNLWISNDHYHDIVKNILNSGPEYGSSNSGKGKKILVEFVSANPTGPLNVVSARSAAIGDSLVRLLNKAGYNADAEFYINDAGRQIQRLGNSVLSIYKGEEVPEDGYHGDDVKDIVTRLGKELENIEDPDIAGKLAADINIAKQKDVLLNFGVSFNRWFRESELYESEAPDKRLSELEKMGALVEKDDAVWFAGSKYGDEDRVVVTSDGRKTYLLPDIAYHLTKADRGYAKAIDLLGPDHHDYIGRMKAALKAFDHEGFLDVLIVQQVNLISGGEKVKMSKRAGKLITLEELVEEVGKDVARYFFLQRKTSSPLDFDLDLAKEQSDQNPVYYVQYAHTRICGILRQDGCPTPSAESDLNVLVHESEIELIKHLEQFDKYISNAAENCEPQRLVGYLNDLATRFHKFYTNCHVISDDETLSKARATLIEAARIVLAEGLNLLGVSAPERM